MTTPNKALATSIMEELYSKGNMSIIEELYQVITYTGLLD